MVGQLDKWAILKNLDPGGQATVSVVTEKGRDPIERIINPLRGLLGISESREQVEQRRKDFGGALLDYVNGKYVIGVLKVNPETAPRGACGMTSVYDLRLSF
jgi:hypothetical protein